jgi:hypothetical protein
LQDYEHFKRITIWDVTPFSLVEVTDVSEEYTGSGFRIKDYVEQRGNKERTPLWLLSEYYMTGLLFDRDALGSLFLRNFRKLLPVYQKMVLLMFTTART